MKILKSFLKGFEMLARSLGNFWVITIVVLSITACGNPIRQIPANCQSYKDYNKVERVVHAWVDANNKIQIEPCDTY